LSEAFFILAIRFSYGLLVADGLPFELVLAEFLFPFAFLDEVFILGGEIFVAFAGIAGRALVSELVT
jgi:hypothetical protein